MTDAFPGPDPYDYGLSDADWEEQLDDLAADEYDYYDDTLSCGCCACCGCDCDYWDDLYEADEDYDDEDID